MLNAKYVLAYAAGIIDGEGCISIFKHRKRRDTKHGYIFALTVRVSNTNEYIINWLKMQFGGGICKMADRTSKGYKNCWQWSLSGKKASDFLKLVEPYLLIKHPQAEIAIAFQVKKSTRRPKKGNPTTDEEIMLQEADYILTQSLNKRGVD